VTSQQYNNIVFYHHPCLDGAASVWAAYKKLGSDDTYYIGADHNGYDRLENTLDEMSLEGVCVYFLDFVPNLPLLKKALNAAERIVILDHHQSSMRQLADFENPKLEKNFDLKHSGARICWDYFAPDHARPVVIDMIEAIDLHRHDFLGKSEAEFFSAAAYLDHFKPQSLSEILALFEKLKNTSFDEMRESGVTFRQQKLDQIDEVLTGCKMVRFPMIEGLSSTDIPFVQANIYDLGREFLPHFLACCAEDSHKIVIAWAKDIHDLYRMNIRTDGKYPANDLAQYLAEHYGLNGGGHANSAAVRFTEDQFQKILEKIL